MVDQQRSAKLITPQSLAVDSSRDAFTSATSITMRSVLLNSTALFERSLEVKDQDISGDGGPASQAQIADPENLWVRKDGSILISVRDNARLRIVSPDGIINTLAGKGPTSMHDYYGPITIPSVEP